MGGIRLSVAPSHSKRAPSRKFIFGGYTAQLSLKFGNSGCPYFMHLIGQSAETNFYTIL